MTAPKDSGVPEGRAPTARFWSLALALVLLIFSTLWLFQHRVRTATSSPDTSPDDALPAQHTEHTERTPPSAERPIALVSKTTHDAIVRARVRQALVQRWSQQSSPTTSSAAETHPNALPEGPRIPAQPLDAEFIRKHFREDFLPLVGQCYDQLQHRVPGSAGALRLRFRVLADETVGSIVETASLESPDGGSPFGDAEFATCVRENLLTVSFAPPPAGGSLEVTYPLDFEPDPPDASAGDQTF